MTLATAEHRDSIIDEYLGLSAAIKSAKARQDEIKLTLQEDMARRDVEEIVSYKGTVKRISVAKSVSFRGGAVYELASAWHVSTDAIFKQCGMLLMNLAQYRPERHYLRISAPK